MARRPKAVVAWTEPAMHDLAAIARYIAERDRGAAERLLERVDEAVERLRTLPRLGRQAPESPEHREVIVAPLRVIYRIDDRRVWIVHVRRFERSGWPPLQ